MGVAGSGKSTVAALLADRLGWDLAEGDEMHPGANVEKMATGQPLDDQDRSPWLAQIAQWTREHVDAGRAGIVTCSALKACYRDALRGPEVVFVHLTGSRDLIEQRLAARRGHYMPASLLESQLATLEPPTPDENAVTVNIGASASDEVAEILRLLGLGDEPNPPTASGPGDTVAG